MVFINVEVANRKVSTWARTWTQDKDATPPWWLETTSFQIVSPQVHNQRETSKTTLISDPFILPTYPLGQGLLDVWRS